MTPPPSETMTPYLFLLLFVGAATASAVEELDIEEEGEGRTVFTSGGNYYIALNTTYLLYYGIIAGSLLLGGLLLSGLLTGGSGAASTAGYGQGYQNRFKRQAFDQSK